MKRIFGNNKADSHDFWMSYTDMMSAFLIVFMIGCIYAYNAYQDKTIKLENAKIQVDSLLTTLRVENPDSLRNKIFTYRRFIDSINSHKLSNEIECYRNVFVETSDIKPIFDVVRGSIKLIDKSPGGELFESGRSSFYKKRTKEVLPLKPYLEKICPALVDTTISIAKRKNVNIELRIEGHTDPNWNGLARGEKESYVRNLKLSSERANAVLELILSDNRLGESQRNFLMEHMISVGYSFSERIERNNIDIDSFDAQSRRIEFRIISK